MQERSWSISCVMRIETHIGDVYFKAVPPFIAQEAAVMSEVSRRHPELILPPLATDVGQGWTLMPDFGGEQLLDTSDISRWEEALQRCARMQVAQADHVQDWLALGVPDRRLNRMMQLIDPLMTISTQTLSGSPPGLSEAEGEGLHALSMQLKLRCPIWPTTVCLRPSFTVIWVAISW